MKNRGLKGKRPRDAGEVERYFFFSRHLPSVPFQDMPGSSPARGLGKLFSRALDSIPLGFPTRKIKSSRWDPALVRRLVELEGHEVGGVHCYSVNLFLPFIFPLMNPLIHTLGP